MKIAVEKLSNEQMESRIDNHASNNTPSLSKYRLGTHSHIHTFCNKK